jgi:hypothetical protein
MKGHAAGRHEGLVEMILESLEGVDRVLVLEDMVKIAEENKVVDRVLVLEGMVKIVEEDKVVAILVMDRVLEEKIGKDTIVVEKDRMVEVQMDHRIGFVLEDLYTVFVVEDDYKPAVHIYRVKLHL